MPVPTGYSEGAVDFLVCYKGYYIAIETKVHPNKATALQIDFMEQIIAAGGISILAYSVRIIEAVLNVVGEDFPNVHRWSKIITDKDAK
jgi:penicillin-binding protein-related factor A (putative recombinase)